MTTYNVKSYAKQRSNSAIKNVVILSFIIAASYTLSFHLIKNAEADDLECGTNISLSDMQNALKSQSSRESQQIPTGSISTPKTKSAPSTPAAATNPTNLQQSTIQKKPIVPEQKAPQQSTIQKKPATKAKTASSPNSSVYTITTKEGHNILVTIEENGKSSAKQATKPAPKKPVKPAPQVNPYASVPAPTKKPSTTPIVVPVQPAKQVKPAKVTQIQPSTSTIYTPSSALQQNDKPKKEKKSKRPIIVVVPPSETINVQTPAPKAKSTEPKNQRNYSEYGDPRWTDPSHTIINNYYLPQEEIEMMKQEAFNNPATTSHLINTGGYETSNAYYRPTSSYSATYSSPSANYTGYGNGQYVDYDTGAYAYPPVTERNVYKKYDTPSPEYYERKAEAVLNQGNNKPAYEARAEERQAERNAEGNRYERRSEERKMEGSSFSTQPANSVEEALERNDGSRVVVVKDY